MKRATIDAEFMGRVERAYFAAIAILEKKSPEEIDENRRNAVVIIDKINKALTGDEAFSALVLALVGLLVALADEREAS